MTATTTMTETLATQYVAPELQIKVALQRPRGVELRRMRGAHSLATLRTAVAEMWPLNKKKQEGRMEHVLEYEDDEGDKVRLTSDAEWMEAVRQLGESPSQAVLKLFVRRKVFEPAVVGHQAGTASGEDSGVTDAEHPDQAHPRCHGRWGRGRGRGWFMQALMKHGAAAGGGEATSATESSDDAAAGSWDMMRKKKGEMWHDWLQKKCQEKWDKKCHREARKANKQMAKAAAKAAEGEQRQGQAPEEEEEVTPAPTTGSAVDDVKDESKPVNKCKREGCGFVKHATQGHAFCCHACRQDKGHGPACARVPTGDNAEAEAVEGEPSTAKPEDWEAVEAVVVPEADAAEGETVPKDTLRC